MFFRNLGLGLAIMAAVGGAALAQSPAPAPSGSPAHGAKAHGDKAHGDKKAAILTRMKTELGLSDAQMTKLEPILASYHEQVKQRMKAGREELDAVLTPEQKAQLKQMHEQRMQERRSNGGTAKTQPGGKRPPSPFTQIGLTDDQKAKLKSLREKNVAQRKADQQALFVQTRTVLTAEQETKFEQQLTHHGKPGGDKHPSKGDKPTAPQPPNAH